MASSADQLSRLLTTGTRDAPSQSIELHAKCTSWNLNDLRVRNNPNLPHQMATNISDNLAMIRGGTLQTEGKTVQTEGIIGIEEREMKESIGLLEHMHHIDQEYVLQKEQADRKCKEAGIDSSRRPIYDAIIRAGIVLNEPQPNITKIHPEHLKRLGIDPSRPSRAMKVASGQAAQTDDAQLTQDVRAVEVEAKMREEGEPLAHYGRLVGNELSHMQELYGLHLEVASQYEVLHNREYNIADDAAIRVRREREEKALVSQRDLARKVRTLFQAVPVPQEDDLRLLIKQLNTLLTNPKAAQNLLDTKINPLINLQYIATNPQVLPELRNAYQMVTGGKNSQIPSEQQYLVKIAQVLNGTGTVTGKVISADERNAAETEIVDDLGQIYRYLDGGRGYPVNLTPEQIVPVFRQFVPALLADPQLPIDLTQMGVKLEKALPKDLPINKITINPDTPQEAILNISVDVEFMGKPMQLPLDLIIKNTAEADGPGIEIDILDQNMKNAAKDRPEYQLITKLPSLLINHINRRLNSRAITGFNIDNGLQIKGGPKPTGSGLGG